MATGLANRLVEQNDVIDMLRREGFYVTQRILTYWRSEGLLPPLVRDGNNYAYDVEVIEQIRELCIQKGKLKTRRLFTHRVEGYEYDIVRLMVLRAKDKIMLLMYEVDGGVLIRTITEEELSCHYQIWRRQ